MTIPSITTWYTTLNKPFFNPPNVVFGPVWTLLYLFMAIAMALVWSSSKKQKNTALQLFLIQLALNFLWSLVFFSWHLIAGAFIVIVLLWITLFLTIKRFLPISKAAGYLLMPYIAWVSFAGLLNLTILFLNL